MSKISGRIPFEVLPPFQALKAKILRGELGEVQIAIDLTWNRIRSCNMYA